MAWKPPSPKEINEANRKFWAERQKAFQEHFTDPNMAAQLVGEMKREELRGIPFEQQRTLDEISHFAEISGKSTVSRRARKAAMAPRPDRLQLLIEEIARRTPGITCRALQEKLEAEVHGTVIEEIANGMISFVDHDDLLNDAPLSGLKHRLSRAKKKILSR